MLTANQITISTPDLNETITLNVSKNPNRIEISADGCGGGDGGESFSDAEGESF